jgi:hypothetical protein
MTGTLFRASWILLLALAAIVAFFSVTSTMGAFRQGPDMLTPAYSVADLAGTNEEAAMAIRGRRVTAATWALAYAVLLGLVVLVPYRRGERWAWWAILASIGVAQLLSVARVSALGLNQGAGTSGILLAVVLLALLAGAPRVFGKPAAA